MSEVSSLLSPLPYTDLDTQRKIGSNREKTAGKLFKALDEASPLKLAEMAKKGTKTGALDLMEAARGRSVNIFV